MRMRKLVLLATPRVGIDRPPTWLPAPTSLYRAPPLAPDWAGGSPAIRPAHRSAPGERLRLSSAVVLGPAHSLSTVLLDDPVLFVGLVTNANQRRRRARKSCPIRGLRGRC